MLRARYQRIQKISLLRISNMSEKTYNVLILCTGNSARSILAEGLMNHLGKGRIKAYSAGSHPMGRVNPHAIKTLQHLRLPVEGLRSKAWDEFAAPGAPALDFVFTVCDSAAGEVCPVWIGQPVTAHWGVEDPSSVEGDEAQKLAAFNKTAMILRRRIELFLSLPLEKLDAMSLQNKLKEIGQQ
jgi:arsenate reductase